MNQTTTPQLSESEVAKIEERDWFLSAESLEKQVALTITERDALVRDWRALRADLKYRCEALEELRQCRDRWLAMLNPASPDETVDGAIRNLQQAYATERDNAAELQTENAALREQLRDATERFEAENETLAKVVKKRNELREQLADARAEGERLAGQLKEWQEEKDTKAGARCGMPGNALMHLLARPVPPVSPFPTPEQTCKCGLPKDDPIHSYTTEWQQMHTFIPKSAPPSTQPSARVAAEIPRTTYKNKRQLSDDERFKLNSALNDYLFNNCDHEHDGYPNHLACRWCALEIIAAISFPSVQPVEEQSETVEKRKQEIFTWRDGDCV